MVGKGLVGNSDGTVFPTTINHIWQRNVATGDVVRDTDFTEWVPKILVLDFADSDFESAVMKIQLGLEQSLTEREKATVRHLLKENLGPDKAQRESLWPCSLMCCGTPHFLQLWNFCPGPSNRQID